MVDAGLRADPNNSELYDRRSNDLMDVGRVAEGLAALHRLAQLDPLMPVKTEALIRGLAFNGHLDEAESLIRKADSFWPNNAMIWSAKFDAAARVGDPSQAAAMLHDPGRPDSLSKGKADYWATFLRARAAPTPANLDTAARSIVRGNDNDPDPFFAAGNLADLGLVDPAYQMLEHAGPSGAGEYQAMFRSYMARFRADHRFMTLALRRGLVAIWRRSGRWPDFCQAAQSPYNCAAEAQRAETAMAPSSSSARQINI